jgi:hypothetical protein
MQDSLIVTAFFDRKKRYNKFLKVFKRSAYKEMSSVKVVTLNMELPPNIDHKRDTAYAFIAAAKYALKSNKPLAIADVDLMFTGDIMSVWKYDFDIAVTVRSNPKYNTGLWFIRPTKTAKLFLKEWIYSTKRLMKLFDKKYKFIWSHGGLDQASLFLAAKKNKTAIIKELPCQVWNACQGDWQFVDDNTKVVHVKSKLRLVAVNNKDIPEGMEYLKPLAKKWRRYLK